MYDKIYFDRLLLFYAYSMYLLLAVKVSFPMTQIYDSGDSQISNPSIPSLTLYELNHCVSYFNYLCKYDAVGGKAPFFISLDETQEHVI